MFLPVGAKAGLRNVKTGNQAVNCCMKDPHSLLWGGGGGGRGSSGTWQGFPWSLVCWAGSPPCRGITRQPGVGCGLADMES